jgi:hypothetical protein
MHLQVEQAQKDLNEARQKYIVDKQDLLEKERTISFAKASNMQLEKQNQAKQKALERQEAEFLEQKDKLQQNHEEQEKREARLLEKEKDLEICRLKVEWARKPNWFTSTEGFHMVDITICSVDIVDKLEKFLRESAAQCPCNDQTCKSMMTAKVVSVQRIENEKLWSVYQAKKEAIKYEVKHAVIKNGSSLYDLSCKTLQLDLPGTKELDPTLNELYL